MEMLLLLFYGSSVVLIESKVMVLGIEEGEYNELI